MPTYILLKELPGVPVGTEMTEVDSRSGEWFAVFGLPFNYNIPLSVRSEWLKEKEIPPVKMPDVKMQKPSERISDLYRQRDSRMDFTHGYIFAIIQYLDELHQK